MAKSIRSKVKRSFRAKKRETGKYAAAEAARLNRLNTKLAAVKEGDRNEDTPLDDTEGVGAEGHPEGGASSVVHNGEGMDLDAADETPISTHGSRGSRREEWRKSKGMDPVPKRHGMNRQGGLAARRKAGRPSRRR
ncbi:hypothetical protein PAXRUDRAFT_821752 [Paxillus rubicundulus Ve08.2h10]|uniref:DUF2423 domain-containing protein n=1 Tax=Paxillus rubicundulus Ve08.2h10 TaxID=930991 RepID=A0A0D0EAJ3_9AGAM|nr:hypothetical protein PAXRUDRAFT_821752 [Paxillus rubicundulus Ve08.2h10]